VGTALIGGWARPVVHWEIVARDPDPGPAGHLRQVV